jgi:transposase-like protein
MDARMSSAGLVHLNGVGSADVLGLWIEQTEDAKFWLKVVNELNASTIS